MMYVLADDGMTPVQVDIQLPSDLLRMKEFSETPDARRVGHTDLGAFGEVSTVFLMTDHSFGSWNGKRAKPVLWETMVFGGPLHGMQWRMTSWVRAVARHRMTRRVLLKIAVEHGGLPVVDALYRLGGNLGEHPTDDER